MILKYSTFQTMSRLNKIYSPLGLFEKLMIRKRKDFVSTITERNFVNFSVMKYISQSSVIIR